MEKMEITGTSSRPCEANASTAQEEWSPSSSSNSIETREPGEALRRGRAALLVLFMRSLTRELLAQAFFLFPDLHLLLGVRHSEMDGKRIIDWSDRKFRKSCAQRWKPKALCGIVLKEPESATYNVGVVHSGESVSLSWHKLLLDRREPANTMCSGEGGLVCFCLMMPGEGDDLGLVIAVVNPLTGASRVLPSNHGVTPFDLKMMQLVVDKKTKQYHVLLVYGEEELRSASSGASQFGDMTEEVPVKEDSKEIQWFQKTLGGVIFDSHTGVWRNARSYSEVFLGPAIHEERYVRDPGLGWKSARDGAPDTCMMDYQGSSKFFGPVAYDCATGKVITLGGMYDQVAPHEFALRKDRLFELYLRLSEYQIRVGENHLVLRKVVKADHLTPGAHGKMKRPDSPLKVLACEGYLLVRESLFEEIFHRRTSYRVVGLLYNMRAGKWVDLRKQKLFQAPESLEELLDLWEESEDADEVALAHGGCPRYFESAPIMLCNLDWEAVP